MKKRDRSYNALAEINVTNLVDVVLVLLIIFMISAPLLQSGIEVDLPKTRAASLDEEAEGVVITIDKKGGIYINDVWSRPENFEKDLDHELKKIGVMSVYLRADSTVPYGRVVDVVSMTKDLGIENLGLVTDKLEINKPGRQ